MLCWQMHDWNNETGHSITIQLRNVVIFMHLPTQLIVRNVVWPKFLTASSTVLDARLAYFNNNIASQK